MQPTKEWYDKFDTIFDNIDPDTTWNQYLTVQLPVSLLKLNLPEISRLHSPAGLGITNENIINLVGQNNPIQNFLTILTVNNLWQCGATVDETRELFEMLCFFVFEEEHTPVIDRLIDYLTSPKGAPGMSLFTPEYIDDFTEDQLRSYNGQPANRWLPKIPTFLNGLRLTDLLSAGFDYPMTRLEEVQAVLDNPEFYDGHVHPEKLVGDLIKQIIIPGKDSNKLLGLFNFCVYLHNKFLAYPTGLDRHNQHTYRERTLIRIIEGSSYYRLFYNSRFEMIHCDRFDRVVADENYLIFIIESICSNQIEIRMDY